MIKSKLLLLLALLSFPWLASAQQSPSGAPGFRVRAVLHDPVNPSADLYLPDQTGRLVRLNLQPEGLLDPQVTALINGSLLIFNSDKVDPRKPESASALAATVAVPANCPHGILILIPSPANSKYAYQGMFLDDTPAAFPKGESKVISLIPVETAIEAGEHKLPIHPGKITKVPPVTKRDEFNNAQTNFYYREGESWVAFTERQLKYVDNCRRIFIVYATPGSTQPFVRTVLDTTPTALPKNP